MSAHVPRVVRATGQLQHHFWGTYVATIGLLFGSIDDASHAHETVFRDWRQYDLVLRWHGGDPELERQIKLLVAHGAERRKIVSVATSIDYGEPFSITIRIGGSGQEEALHQADTSEQMTLELDPAIAKEAADGD